MATRASDLSQVEVVVAIDHDDDATIEMVDQLTIDFPFANFVGFDRKENISCYFNELFHCCHGDYIIAGNDDIEFVTQDFDAIIHEKMAEYLKDKPDGIAMGWLDDGLKNRPNNGFCCFPLLTRAAIQALGFIFPVEFPSWESDQNNWLLFNSVNRICYSTKDVAIRHVSYHCGLRDRDSVSMRVEQLAKKTDRSYQHWGDARKLNDAIKNVQRKLFRQSVR